jgi:hypothetical protein
MSHYIRDDIYAPRHGSVKKVTDVMPISETMAYEVHFLISALGSILISAYS